MARLLYETIQFSPFVWDGETDLPTQFEAAAAAGYDGIGIDVWSVDRHLAGGGTIDELTDALERAGMRCVELQALVVDDAMPSIARPPRFVELVEAFRPEIVMAGFPPCRPMRTSIGFASPSKRSPCTARRWHSSSCR